MGLCRAELSTGLQASVDDRMKTRYTCLKVQPNIAEDGKQEANLSNQATCNVHTVGAKSDAGIHDWGAKFGIGARTCNNHFRLLHHPVN